MIGIIFDSAGEIVEVRIDRTNLMFRTASSGGMFAGINDLRLDYKGVCREFPDLETSPQWREEALKRLKKKVNELGTEEKIKDYIIEDLSKFGFKPLYYQKSGCRVVKIK